MCTGRSSQGQALKSMGDLLGVSLVQGRILHLWLISLLISTATAHTGKETTYTAAGGPCHKMLVINCLIIPHTPSAERPAQLFRPCCTLFATPSSHTIVQNNPRNVNFVDAWCTEHRKTESSDDCALQGDGAGGTSLELTSLLLTAALPAALVQQRVPTCPGAIHALHTFHWITPDTLTAMSSGIETIIRRLVDVRMPSNLSRLLSQCLKSNIAFMSRNCDPFLRHTDA